MTATESGNGVSAESAQGTDEEIAKKKKHDHEDEMVDEWEEESFPASDPPSNY
ncbi:hypothetical protein [Zhihengliuella salsuginis]|uniref:Uncharacterized protein n=1 Tax=Zhihengliuella salsuginis TaxID=578222 RepID=A0ABQ3GE26_9MICC|nr:hypothetical protein [Zhihengliuella salsuginis]GHD02264.1 hypothetical protein GCM10008096_07190 [Zhihengliuella salsuginis]